MSPGPDFEKAAEASALLADVRDRAKRDAVRAIRQLELHLMAALGAETLKGMKDLRPGHQAARIRGSDAGTPFEWLPEPKDGEEFGRSVLCVSNRGRLEMARTARTDGGRIVVSVRPVYDWDLLAEDLEAFSSLLVRLIAEHVERSERSTSSFAKISLLAVRLEAALQDGTRVPSCGDAG